MNLILVFRCLVPSSCASVVGLRPAFHLADIASLTTGRVLHAGRPSTRMHAVLTAEAADLDVTKVPTLWGAVHRIFWLGLRAWWTAVHPPAAHVCHVARRLPSPSPTYPPRIARADGPPWGPGPHPPQGERPGGVCAGCGAWDLAQEGRRCICAKVAQAERPL